MIATGRMQGCGHREQESTVEPRRRLVMACSETFGYVGCPETRRSGRAVTYENCDSPFIDVRGARPTALQGPSTAQGTSHYNATQVQIQAGGGNYGAERRIGYKGLRRGGYDPMEGRQLIQEA